MKTRTVDLIIAGRKEPGYPQYHFNFSFTTVQDLLKQVDKRADELNFRKIDVYVDDETVNFGKDKFTVDEYDYLEEENCEINGGLLSGPNA